ncbi:Scavenger receptor class C type II [Carabus blaptoides fortunei]
MYAKWLLLYVIGVHALLSDCALVSSKPKPCPTLRLARGRVKYFQKGKLARFQCNSFYILAGERYSPCIRGAWETETPVCVKPSCGTVKAPLNGLIYPQYQGAVLNFLCKPGYTLRGSLVTYCDGFSWTNNLPTCVASGSEPPMSCDFESVDLCGWQHDLNHNFDWRRYNFQTPSGHIGTGPRSDHTKGEGKDGYYMYIESSSRLENDTARLLSPVYNKMENGVCFTFYYHMFGTGMGSLLVYVKKQSQSYDTKYLTPEFVERGNQGEVWKRGAVSVPSVDEPFQIIIEGVRGKSYVSDIAIDDVSLAAAECEDNEFSTVSTTEEVSTEMAPMVESCLNRCDNTSDTIYLDSFVLACDCVDTCIENNSCCPDYVAVCILGSGTDFTESYDTSTNDYDHSTEPTVTDITRQRTSAATVPDRTTVEPGTTAESRTSKTEQYSATSDNQP